MSDNSSSSPRLSPSQFALRVAIVLMMVAVALTLFLLRDLLLLVFAALLVALLVDAMAQPIARYGRVPAALAAALSGALLLLVPTLLVASFGREIARQMDTLGTTLPEAGAMLMQYLKAFDAGGTILEAIAGYFPADRVVGVLGGLVSDTAAAIGAGAFALVGGIYIAAQPALYRSGVVRLCPPRYRNQCESLLTASGSALRHWLLGQLAIMTVVGTLTGVGAWVIGVPAPVALGIIAGVLEFVPYLGPIATVVPAFLLGLTEGWETAALALAWVVVVQQIEGYLLTPLVQRRAVSLPPAVTLFSLIGAGLLFGVPGVLLALPLAVICYVAYQSFVPPLSASRSEEGAVLRLPDAR